MPTKKYRNTTDESMNVLGVGEIPAGEEVGLSGQYLPVVILENYPGLVDVTDEVTAEPVTKSSKKKEGKSNV